MRRSLYPRRDLRQLDEVRQVRQVPSLLRGSQRGRHEEEHQGQCGEQVWILQVLLLLNCIDKLFG